MTTFIQSGTRFPCPQCQRLQAFRREIPVNALPLTITCAFEDCGYKHSYSTLDAEHPPIFGKTDPAQRIDGIWQIEMQEAAQDKKYWEQELKGLSFQARIEAVAGHVAGCLQLVHSLRFDLNELADAVASQFEGEWSMMTSFIRMWHPKRVNHFVKNPFFPLETNAPDEFIKQRSKLLLHPNFFVPEVGWYLTEDHGMFAQIITSYTYFMLPPEEWIAAQCKLPYAARLTVAEDKIVGRDLFGCWRDIPGTTPAVDHLEDAPSIRITNSIEARRWLARLGVPPWSKMPATIDAILPVGRQYFEGVGVSDCHRRAWKTFTEHGRMAYFTANRQAAWEFAMTTGMFTNGNKLCILRDSRQREDYARFKTEGMDSTTMSRRFHWKEVCREKDVELTPWSAYNLVIVDYDSSMPLKLLETLHDFHGRLILIHTDPVMDTLEMNLEASLFFSCLNSWHVDERLPGIQAAFDYDLAEHSITTALLANWKQGVR